MLKLAFDSLDIIVFVVVLLRPANPAQKQSKSYSIFRRVCLWERGLTTTVQDCGGASMCCDYRAGRRHRCDMRSRVTAA